MKMMHHLQDQREVWKSAKCTGGSMMKKTPAVSSGRIQKGFHIEAKKEHPREFEDYEIIWHVDGCKEPEVI